MYYHIIREEPMWISVFIFCILFPNFDFQCKMIHLFVRFFQRKKSFYIIRLFSNIWGHYLTFFSDSKLLYLEKRHYIIIFSRLLLHPRITCLFKNSFVSFFSIDDCSRDRFRYVLPEYPKPRRENPEFILIWVILILVREIKMKLTFGFI